MLFDDRLSVLRQGMRVKDRDGLPVGFIREVSGRSVLLSELQGQRVFWIEGSSVEGVRGGEVVLRTSHAG